MSSKSNLWIRAAKRSLAALAIVAGFSLAVPSAFADIALSATATDKTDGGTYSASGTNVLSVAGQKVGHFNVTITSTATDPNPSTLSTTTIDIDNKGSSAATLDIKVSGVGYTTLGGLLLMSGSVQGTSSKGNQGQTASGQMWIDTSNTTYGMPAGGTAGPLNGKLSLNNPSKPLTAGSYVFADGGTYPTVIVHGKVPFSLTQEIILTLGAGAQGQITVSTSVVGSPEPSTMALAGLGALGLIGYGVRRRKARTV